MHKYTRTGLHKARPIEYLKSFIVIVLNLKCGFTQIFRNFKFHRPQSRIETRPSKDSLEVANCNFIAAARKMLTIRQVLVVVKIPHWYLNERNRKLILVLLCSWQFGTCNITAAMTLPPSAWHITCNNRPCNLHVTLHCVTSGRRSGIKQ